jgi:Restriction Enzyme Adenine Methylase Associated
VTGVEWVVLTDGNEWRIYNSHATVPVEEKLFRSVRLDDPEAHAEDTLRLLSKPQMREKSIDVLWKAHFVDRQIKAAIEAMFGAEPDRSLVSLLRKRAPSLRPADIRAGLRRLRLRLDFPIEPTAGAKAANAVEPAQVGVSSPRRANADWSAAKRSGVGTPWRHITLRDLVDGGVLKPPVDIEVRYRGQRLAGQINPDLTVTWDGQTYDSLSTAGGMARKSIIGTQPGRPYPQTNGWTFWRTRGPDGALKTLDDLRRRLFDSQRT